MKIDKRICVLGMIMFLMIVLGGWRNLRKGIELGDLFLVQKSSDYYKKGDTEIRVMEGDGFTNFEIVIYGEQRNASLVWSKDSRLFDVEHDYATITFQDGSVVEGNWFINEMLVGNDGTPLIFKKFPLTITVNGERAPISNETLSNILCRLDLNLLQKNGSGAFIVLGVILYLIGALTFLYPEKMFFLGSRWQFKNPELSDDGIMMQQFGGVICMVAGFVIALNIMGYR